MVLPVSRPLHPGRVTSPPPPRVGWCCAWQFLATPFFLAARNNHLHIIDLLLKYPDIEVDAVTEVGGSNPRDGPLGVMQALCVAWAGCGYRRICPPPFHRCRPLCERAV